MKHIYKYYLLATTTFDKNLNIKANTILKITQMKKLFLNLALLFSIAMFFACEEGLDVNVDTTFTKNMTANIDENLKNSDTLRYPFYEADTLDISDNEKIQENMDKFKGLEIHQIRCELTGIPENEEITEINILIPEANIQISLNAISNANNTLNLEITDELLDFLASFLYENYQVSIMLSGFSSYAPMQLGVKLDFESTLITEL